MLDDVTCQQQMEDQVSLRRSMDCLSQLLPCRERPLWVPCGPAEPSALAPAKLWGSSAGDTVSASQFLKRSRKSVLQAASVQAAHPIPQTGDQQ